MSDDFWIALQEAQVKITELEFKNTKLQAALDEKRDTDAMSALDTGLVVGALLSFAAGTEDKWLAERLRKIANAMHEAASE